MKIEQSTIGEISALLVSAPNYAAIREAINSTTLALRPPIMGVGLPADAAARLAVHLDQLLLVEIAALQLCSVDES